MGLKKPAVVAVVAAMAGLAGFGAARVTAGSFDRHPWAQFGVGSEVTFTTSQVLRYGGQEQRTDGTFTTRYVGEETLTIGGREVRCVVIETTSEQADARMSSRVWQSADVPGFVVKSETTSPQGTQTTTATSFNALP